MTQGMLVDCDTLSRHAVANARDAELLDMIDRRLTPAIHPHDGGPGSLLGVDADDLIFRFGLLPEIRLRFGGSEQAHPTLIPEWFRATLDHTAEGRHLIRTVDQALAMRRQAADLSDANLAHTLRLHAPSRRTWPTYEAHVLYEQIVPEMTRRLAKRL